MPNDLIFNDEEKELIKEAACNPGEGGLEGAARRLHGKFNRPNVTQPQVYDAIRNMRARNRHINVQGRRRMMTVERGDGDMLAFLDTALASGIGAARFAEEAMQRFGDQYTKRSLVAKYKNKVQKRAQLASLPNAAESSHSLSAGNLATSSREHVGQTTAGVIRTTPHGRVLGATIAPYPSQGQAVPLGNSSQHAQQGQAPNMGAKLPKRAHDFGLNPTAAPHDSVPEDFDNMLDRLVEEVQGLPVPPDSPLPFPLAAHEMQPSHYQQLPTHGNVPSFSQNPHQQSTRPIPSTAPPYSAYPQQILDPVTAYNYSHIPTQQGQQPNAMGTVTPTQYAHSMRNQLGPVMPMHSQHPPPSPAHLMQNTQSQPQPQAYYYPTHPGLPQQANQPTVGVHPHMQQVRGNVSSYTASNAISTSNLQAGQPSHYVAQHPHLYGQPGNQYRQ